ncbi:MAG TPA: spore coat protein [Eubacteriales bacterium]|nr:spore coat protein [Eubacteriales bacterium]
MKMNDEQIVKDILSTQKSLAKLCMDAILESSCTKMRKTLGDTHMELTEDQYDCFEYMEKNNLYPIEYAQDQKLDETINKFAAL